MPRPSWLKPPFPCFRRSIAVLSLHKCATSLFANLVLRNLPGRTLVNYQKMHYEEGGTLQARLRSRGYCYGVLRLIDEDHPSYGLTESLLLDLHKVGKILLLIRDPRDILVSMYHSFGFTHPLSPFGPLRSYQLARRERILKQTIDQYALQEAEKLKKKVRRLISLSAPGSGQTVLVVKYEEMVENFDAFFDKLSAFVQVSSTLREELYQSSRPRLVEQPDSHKRSGAPGGFRQHLLPPTVSALSKLLGAELEQFGYARTEENDS